MRYAGEIETMSQFGDTSKTKDRFVQGLRESWGSRELNQWPVEAGRRVVFWD